MRSSIVFDVAIDAQEKCDRCATRFGRGSDVEIN